MGNELSQIVLDDTHIQEVAWLDDETRALVHETIRDLAVRLPHLLAIILYGSVARHEERPVSDEWPSDVDLLAIFDTDDEHVALHEGRNVSSAIVDAIGNHLDAPREVQVMIASRTLGEWDPTFVANVARDGLLLFQQGELPEPLRGVRTISQASEAAPGASDQP